MSRHLKNVMYLSLFMCIAFNVNGQEKLIKGVVSDEKGPLPGVNVVIKGTTNGGETDFDGHYTITADKGGVLIISFIGMKTAEVIVGDITKIDVLLERDQLLEEVVVVGYGSVS